MGKEGRPHQGGGLQTYLRTMFVLFDCLIRSSLVVRRGWNELQLN